MFIHDNILQNLQISQQSMNYYISLKFHIQTHLSILFRQPMQQSSQNNILTLIQTLQQNIQQTDCNNKYLSYQQQILSEISTVYKQYFNNIKNTYTVNKNSKIYAKLLQQYSLLGNSLWSHGQSILKYIIDVNQDNTQDNRNNYVILSHLHNKSQAPLLALYTRLLSHRTKICGSKKQIQKGWSNCTVKYTQIDKNAAFKQLMSSQGIDIQYFQKPEDQIQYIEYGGQGKLHIEIIDIFNIHPSVYIPYIYNYHKKIVNKNIKGKTIIYYLHPAQVEQFNKFHKNLNKINKIQQYIHNLQIYSIFPIQSSTFYQDKFQQQLMVFLNQELNHPNKQDIIIFHDNADQYVKNIKNFIKKTNGDLVKHTHIIAKGGQNRKQTLPPPPVFFNQMAVFSPTLQSKESQKKKPQQYQSQTKSQPNTSQIKSTTQSNLKSIANLPSNQKISHTHNNIYIAPNFKTLIEWGYDLSHVFYIFDYRTDKSFHYDYQFMAYVETYQDYITQKQALLRISCMGINKIGKYCYVREINQEGQRIRESNKEQHSLNDRKAKDIGCYCLQMIKQGFLKQQQVTKEVKNCLKALVEANIIKKQNQNYFILSQEVLKCVLKIRDLNPVLCSSIINAKNCQQQHQVAPAKIAILLSIAASVMMTPQSLRQTSGTTSASNRLTQIWRQTGYLHSCIDIVIRAKIIQHRQKSINQGKKSKKIISRRLSKPTQQQFQVFGDLFEICTAERLTFDQMKLQDLLREQFVNQNVYHTIVNLAEKIAEVLELQDFIFNSFQDINAVVVDLIKKASKAVGIYSGSRRVGYFIKGQHQGLFPNKSSLLSSLNQRPNFLYITRLISTLPIDQTTKYQILMANSIPQMTLIQTLGMLPPRKTKSYGQTQIQYHGIASATFKALWRNNGSDIISFQDKNSCFVEPSQQIALISIHCPKQKQILVKKQFDNLLTKVKQKLGAQTKISHFLGVTSLLLGSGGSVLHVIKDKYINKCALSNLDLNTQVEDLQQLFQQFFNLKDIKIVRQPPTASYKTAYIEFHSQKDYYRFYQYYNECLYLNRYLKVAPIQSIPKASSYAQQMYLQFIWNAWKSNHQAIVQFQDQAACIKCIDDLKQVKLDGKNVKTQLRNGNKIYIVGLNSLTDEINLQQMLHNYGKVKSLQILKTPAKQNLKSLQNTLQQQIKKNVPNLNDIQVKNVQKLKNGLRKCRVVYKNQAKLNQTIQKLKQKTGVMGLGRIHIKSWFVYPIKIVHGYLSLYQQLVNSAFKKIPDHKIKIQNLIYNEQQYIIAKSNLKQQIDLYKNNINIQLQGYAVPLTGLQINIVLTEVGIRNLIDLEEKYNCRLIPDFGKKTLIVLATFEDVKAIKQEIKAKVQDNFFYRIPLNQKSFKHFKQNPEACDNMKKQYHLTDFQLEEVGKNLLLQGNANHVQKAFNYLMHIIQSVSKPNQEQMLNADVCGICCQEPFRPYRLQQCGHKFCINCILDAINSALGDISTFPIKCPQCLVQIAIIDLQQLLTPETWPKLKSMGLSQYIGRNAEIISNCYTAGCKQVNFLIKNYFHCDQCQQNYCTGCKLNYHPGLTCEQAKQGGNAAFEKYLKQHGIRKCPNQSCKMPIQRTDGCYRVTCSRCNKSMCFKCQSEKMIPYDHYNDCYKHLTDVHGGYW